MSAGRGAADAARTLYRELAPARARYVRPAATRTRSRAGSCSGRWSAMALICRPDLDRLRRADDGPRRHHPDRGPGGDPEGDPRATARPPSTSPTISPWWRRWPTGSWCCATARWSRRARPPDPQRTAGGLHPGPGRRPPGAPEARQPQPSRRCWRCAAMAAAYGGGSFPVLQDIDLDLPAGPHAGRRRRERQRQEHARPRRSPACCRRDGRLRYRRPATCRRRLARPHQGQLRQLQMIHQMPDVALNPRQTVGAILGRPARLLLRPARPGARAPGRRAPARQIEPDPSFRRPLPGPSSRAARSSASASRARWPPSPTSSSATRSPRPSTRWWPTASSSCSLGSSARPASPI